jgi:hypothetical protein
MHDLNLELAMDRSREMLRTAERDRLAATATANQPGAADRAALAASDLLVGAGLHLEHWARRRRLRRVMARTHVFQ